MSTAPFLGFEAIVVANLKRPKTKKRQSGCRTPKIEESL